MEKTPNFFWQRVTGLNSLYPVNLIHGYFSHIGTVFNVILLSLKNLTYKLVNPY